MILITGGTGFLGSYIVKHLIEKGYAVRAIRRSQKLPLQLCTEISNKVEWLDGDILDMFALQKAFDGVDTVIHAAGIVSFSKWNRTEMYEVNIKGTANMVNMALKNGIKKFIHVSSISAVAMTANGEHVDEEKEWVENKLTTHYALSKFKGEQEVWRGIHKGLDAVILNPSMILGFGDWNNGSCAIFKRVYKGFQWYSNGVSGFVDVEDVARVAVLLMENNIIGQRFIINSENWTSKKLIETIAAGFGRKKPSKKVTTFLLSVLWRLDTFKSVFTAQPPQLTREIIIAAQSRTYFENGKILKALPCFSFMPMEQSVRKACEKYLDLVIQSKKN